MIDIKTFNEAVLNIISNIHDALPEVDTKEGTFLRDVMINPVANEFADLYNNLYKMELSQSLLTCIGDDLDRLAANYFIQRKTGTTSTGKVRFYIENTNKDSPDAKYPDIKIPKNTIVATVGSAAQPSLQFVTKNDILIYGSESSTQININNTTITNGIIGLPRDSTGYRYIEIECESLGVGSNYNVGPYTITSMVTSSLSYIYKVGNKYAFSGGTDAENDMSLALRVGLAITGCNIGTKDGYLSYILQQPQVEDAIIIGAGDEFMKRDYMKIVDNDGQIYEGHMGGKVDIYVRTNSNSQDEFTYTVTNDDFQNGSFIKQIYFPENSYPIDKVLNIQGEKIDSVNKKSTYVSYINADSYELENISNKNNGYVPQYYLDILWDFSIKNYFPDMLYNPLSPNISENEIIRLKNKIDNELLIAKQHLKNLTYKIQWDLMGDPIIGNTDKNKPDSTTLFNYYKYTDGCYYKIITKSDDEDSEDAKLYNSRQFVLKENKIYVRVPITPDFRVIKDTSDYMGSYKAQDYIQWFKQTSENSSIHIPQENEILTIKYTYNSGISQLQDGMEDKRILTADVLVKTAYVKNIEIKFNAICSPSYDPDIMYTTISNALSYYVNNKKLGAYLDQSDIVYVVKGIDGILSVDIDTVELDSVIKDTGEVVSEKSIKCNPNEYFNLNNLVINITNSGI